VTPPLTTVNVTANSPATLIFGGQGSNATPMQVINNDTVSSVWVGNQSNLTPGQAGAVELGPGSSVAFDGSVSVYGIVAAAGSELSPSWATGGWDLVFDDEFTGTALDTTKWNPNWFGSGITGPVNSGETATYSDAYVTVAGGYLQMLLNDVSSDGGAHPNTGSIVTTNPHDGRASGGFEFAYGAVEWRAYLPPDTAGNAIANWPALWLDSQDWPATGEFDVVEGISGTAQWGIPTNIPYDTVFGNGPGTYYGWHQFGVQWDQGGLVTFYYDGQAVSTAIAAQNGDSLMYLIMDNTQGSEGGAGTFPATMLVDWARVWQPSGGTASAAVSVIPGGSNYSPGTLQISGTTTVNIDGPVTIDGLTEVVGEGGYILPGVYQALVNDSGGHTLTNSGGQPVPYVTPLASVQDFQSFSLSVQAYCGSQSTADAPLTLPVQLSWYADEAGEFLVEQETWWMWVASGATEAAKCPLIGGGAARGAYLSVAFSNLSDTANIDVTQITLTGNGRSSGNPRFYQTPPYAGIASGVMVLSTVNPALLNLEGYPNGSDGILANESSNGNIAASQTYWLPLPLFSGQVWARFSTSIALASDFVLCTAAPLANGQVTPGASSQGVIWNPGNAAGTDYTAVLQLGNAPAYAVFKATAAAPVITLEIQGSPV
jgi:hypothetical protein